jgi:hypothetical protein
VFASFEFAFVGSFFKQERFLRPHIDFDGDDDAFDSGKNLELLSFWTGKACPEHDSNQQLSTLFLSKNGFHRSPIMLIMKRREPDPFPLRKDRLTFFG